jgi:tripartite ATP-independent transporter DctM subunit
MIFKNVTQDKAVSLVSAMIVIALVIVTSLQVISRYIFNSPYSWTEEVARILFIWVIFLGVFLALKTNDHVRFASFVDWFFLPKGKAIVSSFISILITIYLGYLAVTGFQMVNVVKNGLTPALGIPIPFLFVVIPLSSIMMIVYLLYKFLKQGWTTNLVSGMMAIAIFVLCYVIFSNTRISDGYLVLFLLATLILLILLGTPIAFSIGISTLLFLIVQNRIPLGIIHNRMIGGVDSFTLLAIPFFILAGELMNTGGITHRLVNLAKVIVGHVRGGLGMVVVVGEYFFSGISGSTVADVSAIGALLIPGMVKAGYKVENAVSIVSAAAAMGILVPPCITMVVVAGMTDLSVGALFAGGFIPAIVLAVCIMVIIYYQAVKDKIPAEKRVGLREATKAIAGAIIPLLLPVIIFAGILSGAVTATEVAVVAVIYGFLVGSIIYKEIKLDHLIPILISTVKTTGMVMFLIATASVLSWIFATNGVPQKLGEFVSYFSNSKIVFFMFTIIVFIIVGGALEGLPAMIILIPVFLPLVKQYGIDPLHFAIVAVATNGIGVFVPPIGMGIGIACGIGGIEVGRAIKPFMPYLIALILGLFIVAFVPWLTLVLPHIFFPVK